MSLQVLRRGLLVAGLAISPIASAGLIDFETFSKGDWINGTAIADAHGSGVLMGVDASVPINAGTFSGGSFPGLPDAHPYDDDPLGSGREAAVIFDTADPSGGDADLGSPFSNTGLGPKSPGNVVILHEQPEECVGAISPGVGDPIGTCSMGSGQNGPDDVGRQPAGRFLLQFSVAVLLDSIDFFDVETDENGSTDLNKNGILLFNGASQVATSFVPDTGGNNKWAPVDFGGVLVDRVEIRLHGSGAFDNVAFTTTTVPAPGALALLLGGLALLGWRRAA